MQKSSKFAFALTGLAVLCVCAAMAAPMGGAGDGAGHGGMMADGDAPVMNEDIPAMNEDTPAMKDDGTAMGDDRPAMNEERMQEMITKMQANGVDTTELETALENGDQEAVHTFLQENRPADAPEQKGEDKGEGQMHAMNEERMQAMIAMMQANGVDTTALETALENGDREAVHTFMQENKPADAGTGLRHGGPSAE